MNDFFAMFGAYSVAQLEKLVREPPAGHAPSVIDLLAPSIALEETKLRGQELQQRIIQSAAYREHLNRGKGFVDALGLGEPDSVELGELPQFSFYLRIDFRLATPYISRDDQAFSVTQRTLYAKTRFSGCPLWHRPPGRERCETPAGWCGPSV